MNRPLDIHDEPDVLFCRDCDSAMSPGEQVVDDRCESCQARATSEPGETSDVERYRIPRRELTASEPSAEVGITRCPLGSAQQAGFAPGTSALDSAASGLSANDHFDSRGFHTDVDAARGEAEDYVASLTTKPHRTERHGGLKG